MAVFGDPRETYRSVSGVIRPMNDCHNPAAAVEPPSVHGFYADWIHGFVRLVENIS